MSQYIEHNINIFEQKKNDLQKVIAQLQQLPQTLKSDIQLPLNSVAYVNAILYHTNEVMVSLGDNYFVERSCPQAIDIAQRRISIIDKKIEQIKQFSKQENDKPLEIEETLEESEELFLQAQQIQIPTQKNEIQFKDYKESKTFKLLQYAKEQEQQNVAIDKIDFNLFHKKLQDQEQQKKKVTFQNTAKQSDQPIENVSQDEPRKISKFKQQRLDQKI